MTVEQDFFGWVFDYPRDRNEQKTRAAIARYVLANQSSVGWLRYLNDGYTIEDIKHG